MFIHAQITTEIAAKYNSDAADIVVYIPPHAIDCSASLCIWIVPNTEINS